MAKKFDAKAKAKRQKIIAAVGGVILLGVLAFQVPRTMKMLNQKGADTSAPASTTATATTPLPSTGSAATAISAGAGDGLVDPDGVPAPQSGQLLAFSRFRTKDPFSQQLDLTCAGGGTSSGVSTGAGCGSRAGSGSVSTSSSSASPATGKKEPAAPSSEGGAVAPAGPPAAKAPAPKPTTATISVNGQSESISVGAQFPAANPTFTLVSLTKTSAKIGIAGGSFESGGATVTLQKNKPLTLMNTADGTRYVLRLISIS